MVFQSTAAFHHLSSYMVHSTKSLASVGLTQARPNDTETNKVFVTVVVFTHDAPVG